MWTSPISSISDLRYYVLFLDHYIHFLWVYSLRRKSEVFSKFLHFHSFIQNQFQTTIKAFQCDNGGEFNNSNFHKFFDSNGIQVRFSCPHISQQKEKSERMIRIFNNAIRTLLFQAKFSPTYWDEALHVAVYLLNILPSSAIKNQVPYFLLLHKPPRYDHLKVFGCLCFSNLNYSNLHKLSPPRTTPCLFFGYPSQHRGYRCLDLKTNRIIISRHVAFDETIFPAAVTAQEESPAYQSLSHIEESSPLFQNILQTTLAQPPPPPQPAPAPPTNPPPPPPQTTTAPSQPTHSMTIYTFQTPGCVDQKAYDHVCKLNKSLYGLKQAPQAWNSRFSCFMTDISFVASKSDASLFVFRKGDQQLYLLLNVDDIILTASTSNFLHCIITLLKTEFPMTDIGKLHYFLGVKAEFKDGGITLSQSAYALDIIA